MANTANSSTLTTNFNVSPYYDDYDPSKGYYRLLFKPGRAVQARELTQIQTVLQNQVARVGKHLFKEGSIVLPGLYDIYSSSSTNGSIAYIKVRDVDNSNNEVNISEFQDQTVRGATSNVTAVISFVMDGAEGNVNTKTIYVDYTSVSNTNTQIRTFQTGETLIANVGNLVVANTANNIGRASAFRITEGVFFAKDHFIHFPSQGIILDRYNENPSCKVGFRITESIVDYSDDLSLLDPALESSNYSAPGADRLKLHASLQVLDFADTEGAPDFVTLFTIRDGVIQTTNERTEYNILGDEMAKRTFDESGHYYVKGMDLSVREHLDTGLNGGYLASANGGNSLFLSVQVSPGVAYVQGYEVGKLVPTYIDLGKAREYKNVNSQLASAAMGSYVTVKEVTGSWGMDRGTLIDLYDTAQGRLTTSKWSTGAQTGNRIGTAKLMSIEYNTGTMGTPNGKFDIYLSDIRMIGSNVFSNVRSIYYDNASGTADMGADIVLSTSTNTAVLQAASLNPLLYFVGSDWTKTLKPENVSDTTFIYKQTTAVSNVASGSFNVSLPAGASQFPYGTATLSDTQRREIIVALGADANVAMSGTVSNSGTTIIGSGTAFDTRLNVGDKISITGVAGVYYIGSISNSTYMTVTTALATSASGAAFTKTYKNGDIIDLTTIGATSAQQREVTATPTQLSFALREVMQGGAIPATVTYKVSATSAPQLGKTLRSDRFVRINVANSGANTAGPFGLGIADVFRIKEIRSSATQFTANTEGANVMSQFIFDTGQRDTHYDHASISPKVPIANNTHLLVRLDYFVPDYTVGKGFFSVDSYPIDDGNTTSTTINTAQIPVYKSPTSGATYDLRNYLDFRPVKTQTASDATTVAASSISPAQANTYQQDANGLRLPAPYSQISYDYEYYLGRKDVIVLNKTGTFQVVRGVSAASPVTPQVQDDMMAIGTITVTPYPSISRFYANQINRKELAVNAKKTAPVRFTMRDIGVLKNRIINLEKYAALSLLEKAAADMKILDANGLDRFKNGIFVDTFSNHSLGATYNLDYNIVVDPKEKSIRPIYNMDSFYYEYLSGTNVTRTGDIVTLSYTEVPFITQTAVTTTRNTERTSWRYLGKVTLTPSEDVWVDTSYAPDMSVTFGPSDSEVAEMTGGVTTTWNSWQQYITGYKVYAGTTASDASLIGSYTDFNSAQLAADAIRLDGDVTIETLYASERTGTENWTIVDEYTNSIGDKVIDVALQPYIRPQVIKMFVQGIKPYAKYYTYFDNVNMTDYTTPLTEAEYNSANTIIDSTREGSSLTASANGECWLSLRLPATSEKKFTTGTKQVKITDAPNNTDDATSLAIGYFFAQGLVQQKQETIITTRQVIDKESTIAAYKNDPSQLLNLDKIEPIVITNVITNTVIIEVAAPPPPPPPVEDPPPVFAGSDGGGGGDGGCMAYAFTVKAPRGEDGVFVTSVDVYFADKHPTLGIWFELLEVDEGGGITQNQVPFSYVWKKTNEINISTDGLTNATRITFQAPIFLQNGKTYAFAIHPEAVNPNYYMWAARIGEIDINTGEAHNSRLYTGTLFTTNNGVIWGQVPDVDIAFVLNRASFSTNVDGIINLGNEPKEKLVLGNVSSSLTNIGETFRSGDRLTLSIAGGTITEGNYLIGATSAVNSAVKTIETTYNMANTGYVSGESLTVRRANGLVTAITASISSITARANGVLQKSKETSANVRVTLNKSNGLFKANDYIIAASYSNSGQILKAENFRYSVIDVEPAYLKFNKSVVVFEMKTYSNTGVEGSFIHINPSENYFFSDERAIYSRLNEVASLSSARTNQLKVTMRTTTDYTSPVLDLARTHAIIVDNIINANVMNENLASGGNLYNKYISKTVTLAEDQDAEDMRLVVTAYRPPTTDVKVWVKILHSEDGDLFSNRPWIELEKQDEGDTVYSSLANRDEFIEYEYAFPTANMTGSLGEFQYRNAANTATHTGYKYFAVKIGLTGENSAVVPRVADLRVIALQI
jgi:hypothetical protein